MKTIKLIFVGIIFSMISCEQNTNDPLSDILRSNDLLKRVVENENHEVQIIWTQINRNSANRPTFDTYRYQVDPDKYFYPASTVKLPIALLALEKVNTLQIPELTKTSTFFTDSAYSGQTAALYDTTSENGKPSIAHYIKKILLVSDNDAYNRLYEFIGQQSINDQLGKKGYNQTRISHRLSIALSPDENQHTNPVRFYNDDSLVYHQELVKNSRPPMSEEPILKGIGYTKGADNTLVNAPFDFSKKNFIPLEELQLMLRSIIFPEAMANSKRFNLTAADYKFLYQYLSQLPSETTFPDYSSEEYYDAYVKFLMFGNSKEPIPKHIRIFNKIGQAYGYMTENAYVIDLENNIEFLLSAVVHVNANQIYNDGVYEYDSIGFPFMKELGQEVYKYELNRKRKFPARLDKFRLTYDLE